MTVINTLVARSTNVKEAALNLNAKAFETRRTLAGVWDLQPSDSTHAPESALMLDMKNESQESVVGGDERLLVDERHFSPGGKYRSIVKLFIHYEFQGAGQYAMGTGWLVRPDVLVTAGHCTYDWSHKLGRATEIKAYIGYKGKGSVNDQNVQFRTAKRIVTTEGWLKAKGAKNFDVGFVQVNKPFTGIKPFTFTETPSRGDLTLGVVGYPGDLEDKRTKEKGALMYEMFLPTQYDLATQADTMLEYQIDTFGGNSGSPVLRESDLVSLGAHVYGGTNNSASVIGRFGNPYNDYLTAFALDSPKVKEGVNLVPVSDTAGGTICPNCQAQIKCPNCNQAAAAPALGPGFSPKGPYTNGSKAVSKNTSQSRRVPSQRTGPTKDEEGLFMDIMKGAASVVGPFGGPLGILASVAINAASTLAESTNAESTLDSSALHEGTVERAILADAALTAVQTMKLHPEEEEGIFSDMKDFIVKAAPAVRRVAPKVLGAMMEPALRMAMDSLHDYNQGNQRGAEGLFDAPAAPALPHITYSAQIDQPGDVNSQAFVSGLHNALQAGQESYGDESEEGFLDILKAGVHYAGKGLSFAVKNGLPILAQAMSGAESLDAESLEADPPTANPSSVSTDALAKRAIAGEAALQALMKLEPHRLEEEGFFDFIASTVKHIAPVVLKVAPAVISNISPTIGGILKSVTSQEAGFAGFDPDAPRRLPARPTLGKKPSAMSLRRKEGPNDGANDFLARLGARR